MPADLRGDLLGGNRLRPPHYLHKLPAVLPELRLRQDSTP
jgi:hypothetical protein